MDARYWVTATLIVAGILVFLAWDPKASTDRDDATPARATVTELEEDAAHVPIATVELDPGITRDSGAGAGSSLIARFESETRDPAWATVAEARVRAMLGEVTPIQIECRRTACRLTVSFTTMADRPAGVADLLAQLQDKGVPALLESVEDDRAVLLVAP
jgi:hypothetical protein